MLRRQHFLFTIKNGSEKKSEFLIKCQSSHFNDSEAQRNINDTVNDF